MFGQNQLDQQTQSNQLDQQTQSNQLDQQKTYRIAYLVYGSIYADLVSKKCQIINGPNIPVRLSGVAFTNSNNIRLTRNLHPLGTFTRSFLFIMETSNVEESISNLLDREYYDNYDQEPLCYFKRKPNNKSILKIPFYNSYNNILKQYAHMIKYLDSELEKLSNKYDLDYIFFISYDHRIDLLGVDHLLGKKEFENKLFKLIFKNQKHDLIYNTKKYLKLCNEKTYTWIEHFIVDYIV
jgi:hypothetical protein